LASQPNAREILGDPVVPFRPMMSPPGGVPDRREVTSTHFDTLLSRLISGRLRLPEAEAIGV